MTDDEKPTAAAAPDPATPEATEPEAKPADVPAEAAPEVVVREPTGREIIDYVEARIGPLQPRTQEDRESLTEIVNWGKLMAISGLFPDTKNYAQAAVKILAARSMGFDALEGMTGIHLIEGRVTAGANLQAAAVKRSGRYDYRVLLHSDTECSIAFYRLCHGGMEHYPNPDAPDDHHENTRWEFIGTSNFTVEDANRAGLVQPRGQQSQTNWQKFPRNMTFARAMTNGIKWYCPDVFMGATLYTPEEIRPDIELDDTGEVRSRTIAIDPPDIAQAIPDAQPVPDRRQARPSQQAAPSRRAQPSRPAQQQRPAQQARPQQQARPNQSAQSGEITSVSDLIRWAVEFGDQQGVPIDQPQICLVLDVPQPGQIPQKFKGKAGLAEAQQIIRNWVAQTLGGEGPPESADPASSDEDEESAPPEEGEEPTEEELGSDLTPEEEAAAEKGAAKVAEARAATAAADKIHEGQQAELPAEDTTDA